MEYEVAKITKEHSEIAMGPEAWKEETDDVKEDETVVCEVLPL